MARVNEPTAEGISLLKPYYNNILGVQERGGTRADAWAAVQAGMAEGGADYTGATIFDMNYLWGQAGAVLAAQNSFEAQSPEDALAAQSISWAPWAVQTTAAQLNPQAAIRYEWLGQTPDGEVVSQWFQTDWSGTLDVTKQDVLDRVTASAQLSLDTYQAASLAALGLPQGVVVTGIGRVQVLRF